MPPLQVDVATLLEWGRIWRSDVGTPTAAGVPKPKAVNSFDKKQGMDFGMVFDTAFANALAAMLGDIPVAGQRRPAATAKGSIANDPGNLAATAITIGLGP